VLAIVRLGNTTIAEVLTGSRVAAAGPGEFQYTSSKGFRYVLNTTFVTAEEAQKRAEELGGTLVCWWVRWHGRRFTNCACANELPQ
jgi:hypothetical protein